MERKFSVHSKFISLALSRWIFFKRGEFLSRRVHTAIWHGRPHTHIQTQEQTQTTSAGRCTADALLHSTDTATNIHPVAVCHSKNLSFSHFNYGAYLVSVCTCLLWQTRPLPSALAAAQHQPTVAHSLTWILRLRCRVQWQIRSVTLHTPVPCLSLNFQPASCQRSRNENIYAGEMS